MISGSNKDQIIIVGAGIAGLSLAIQLAEKKNTLHSA